MSKKDQIVKNHTPDNKIPEMIWENKITRTRTARSQKMDDAKNVPHASICRKMEEANASQLILSVRQVMNMETVIAAIKDTLSRVVAV